MEENNEQPMRVGKIVFGKRFSNSEIGKTITIPPVLLGTESLVMELVDSILAWWQVAQYESVVGYDGGPETYPLYRDKPDFVKCAERLKKMIDAK